MLCNPQHVGGIGQNPIYVPVCTYRGHYGPANPPPRSLRSALLILGGKVTHCHNPATTTTHVALTRAQETVSYGSLLPPPVPRSCYCLDARPLVPQVAVSTRRRSCHYRAKSHHHCRLALSQCSAWNAPLSPSTRACLACLQLITLCLTGSKGEVIGMQHCVATVGSIIRRKRQW